MQKLFNPDIYIYIYLILYPVCIATICICRFNVLFYTGNKLVLIKMHHLYCSCKNEDKKKKNNVKWSIATHYRIVKIWLQRHMKYVALSLFYRIYFTNTHCSVKRIRARFQTLKQLILRKRSAVKWHRNISTSSSF